MSNADLLKVLLLAAIAVMLFLAMIADDISF